MKKKSDSGKQAHSEDLLLKLTLGLAEQIESLPQSTHT